MPPKTGCQPSNTVEKALNHVLLKYKPRSMLPMLMLNLMLRMPILNPCPRGEPIPSVIIPLKKCRKKVCLSGWHSIKKSGSGANNTKRIAGRSGVPRLLRLVCLQNTSWDGGSL